MRPSELSNLLWAQVDRVAPHLLPNGKKEGHEWVAGNVNGDKGNSLKVNLSGKKKWADFAEGDGGDMLDLWMACRGINLHQAMQEAKAFLGIKDDDHHFDAKREKKFSRPDRKKIARYVTRTESHLEYLQSRGISPEVVKRYEVVSGKVWNGERELDALVTKETQSTTVSATASQADVTGVVPAMEGENASAAQPDVNAQITAAVAAENSRIMGILNCEEAHGREEQARVLAETPGMTVETARRILAAAPQSAQARSDTALDRLMQGAPAPLAAGNPASDAVNDLLNTPV